MAGAGGRINSAYEASMGKNPNVNDVLQGLIKERSTAAAPLYNQAYSEGDRAIWSPALERLTGAPEVQDAMRGAVSGWQRSQIANGYGAAKPGAFVQNGLLEDSRAVAFRHSRIFNSGIIPRTRLTTWWRMRSSRMAR